MRTGESEVIFTTKQNPEQIEKKIWRAKGKFKHEIHGCMKSAQNKR